MLFVIMFIKIRLNYINLKILMFTYMYANSPIQSPSSMPVVSFRVLYGELHRHNKDRDVDNLWDTDNRYCYVDRAWCYLSNASVKILPILR